MNLESRRRIQTRDVTMSDDFTTAQTLATAVELVVSTLTYPNRPSDFHTSFNPITERTPARIPSISWARIFQGRFFEVLASLSF